MKQTVTTRGGKSDGLLVGGDKWKVVVKVTDID